VSHQGNRYARHYCGTADDVNTRNSGTAGADEFNFPLVTRGMKNDDFIGNVTPPAALSIRGACKI